MALRNHKSVSLARAEVELAQSRAGVTLRALFPGLSLKAETTRGRSLGQPDSPEFREENYGLEAAQTLFSGGRNLRAYLQSRAAESLARAQLDLAEQEARLGARAAYWAWVKAVRVQDVYAAALVDLDQEKNRADRLLQNDMLSPQVYMVIVSQQRQGAYLLESARADLELRLWQWTQALGLDSPPGVRPDPAAPAPALENVRLEDCLEQARAHPEIRAQKAALRSAQLGEKIARGALWPQVEIYGFYGKSGAAYKSEGLDLKEDWQAGIKAALHFGGSSARLSGISQKTSPRIGQSARTRIESLSASFALLDDMKARTERRQAEWARRQADARAEETEMEVRNRVREAYASWRQGVAQLKIAENDLAIALMEKSAAEIRSSHREVPFSERAVARNRVARAQAALAEAQSGIAIAAAELQRAVGKDPPFPALEK